MPITCCTYQMPTIPHGLWLQPLVSSCIKDPFWEPDETLRGFIHRPLLKINHLGQQKRGGSTAKYGRCRSWMDQKGPWTLGRGSKRLEGRQEGSCQIFSPVIHNLPTRGAISTVDTVSPIQCPLLQHDSLVSWRCSDIPCLKGLGWI